MGLCETFSTCFVSAVKDAFYQLKFRPALQNAAQLK